MFVLPRFYCKRESEKEGRPVSLSSTLRNIIPPANDKIKYNSSNVEGGTEKHHLEKLQSNKLNLGA